MGKSIILSSPKTNHLTYEEKLKSPKWQRKRNFILNRDNYTCKSCGNTERQLHVHHLLYIPNTDPWDYTDDALITYCDYCHNTVHLIGNLLQNNLLDIIQRNRLLVRPLAQPCILCEKKDGFVDQINEYLNKETVSYIDSRKHKKDG